MSAWYISSDHDFFFEVYISKVMAGSSISDILECCYDPNVVIHMLMARL